MRGVNKVILVGTLGQEVDIKEFPNGGKLANFSIATNESWTDKQTGERKESTEWHRIVVNNRLAEIAKQYLKKGSKVYIEGSLRTRQWTDQNGQERYTTEIRAENLQMLDGQNQGGNGGYNNQGGNGGYNNQGGNSGYNNQGGNGGYNNQGGNGGYGNQGGNGGYGNQGGNGGYGNQGGNGGYGNQGGNKPNGRSAPKNPQQNQPNADLDDDLPF